MRRVYLVSTGLLVAVMLSSALADVLHAQPIVDDFRRLGYPDYLITPLGLIKLMGVAALVHPAAVRLREWAYAGFSFELGGATISQIAAGSSFVQVLAPLSCAALVATSYVARRAVSARRSPRERALAA